jgi:hypothetical protein
MLLINNKIISLIKIHEEWIDILVLEDDQLENCGEQYPKPFEHVLWLHRAGPAKSIVSAGHIYVNNSR